MHVGALNLRSSVRIPSLGITISVADIRTALCAMLRLDSAACTRCDALCPLINDPNKLERMVLDLVVDLVERAIPAVGNACGDPDLATIAGMFSVSFGSDGVSVSVDASAVLQFALCQMAQFGIRESNMLDVPARALAGALRDLCPECAPGAGTTINSNSYGLTAPVVPQPPVVPPPAQIAPAPPRVVVTPGLAPGVVRLSRETYYSNRTRTAQPAFTPALSSVKRRYTSLVVAGGVALAASSVILFLRR